jgi:hypothetical protein
MLRRCGGRVPWQRRLVFAIRLIEISGAVFGRALRARRLAQERRQCARSEREISRIGGG